MEKKRLKKTIVPIMTILVVFSVFSMYKVRLVEANNKNKVDLEVSLGYGYNTEEDIVINVPYPRSQRWLFQITNLEDETGQPVTNPEITVLTDREFVDFGFWKPVISDGEYNWDFSQELPEGFMLPASAREPNHMDYSRPGFSAERSVSPEILVEAVTIQNLSLNFKLEDTLPSDVNLIQIYVGLPNIIFQEEKLVNYTVLSLNDVEDWSKETEGWYARPSDVSIGKTYHFEATLETVKLPNLGGTPTAKPRIQIHYAHWDALENIGTGYSATVTHPEGPTVTVSADGEYEWHAGVSYSRQDFTFNQVISEVIENPNPPPPYTVKIPATIDIDPDPLDLKNEGQGITGCIELPENYNVADVNASSILLNDTIPVNPTAPTSVGDEDGDDIPDLTVKFNRAEVTSYILANEETSMNMTLTLTGKLNDETLFQGSDTIRILSPPIISILSPENKTYSVNDIPLTYTVDESTSWIGYSLDGQANVTITGNITIPSLSDGTHSVMVYAGDTAGNVGASEVIYFTIETKQADSLQPWIVVVIVIVAGVGATLVGYLAKVKKTTEKVK